MITVVGPQESPNYYDCPFFINSTSRSKTWSVELSPFIRGPVGLWFGAPTEFAYNVENGWQYSKVYKEHIGKDGLPNSSWYKWARNGFQTKGAVRYPKGKGTHPEYAYWNNQCLDYIESRKQIYIPMYKDAVRNTEAFSRLCDIYSKYKKIIIWCYDGYNRKYYNMSIDDVINCSTRNMGHSFVLEQMLLEEFGKEF